MKFSDHSLRQKGEAYIGRKSKSLSPSARQDSAVNRLAVNPLIDPKSLHKCRNGLLHDKCGGWDSECRSHEYPSHLLQPDVSTRARYPSISSPKIDTCAPRERWIKQMAFGWSLAVCAYSFSCLSFQDAAHKNSRNDRRIVNYVPVIATHKPDKKQS
uniref:Uncharacterized protein n=1 Tax=Candidatus Kentrum sp. FM TaxID=2126340 RepID=A0A450T6I3_9GAMM|nr:MAG: hypothetical protein BECKFM1743A_GA0114220_100773 [Candidatus Kentron sp. FM]VFJ62138.1 MAG: hypothetical protein BECKFM1743C_GA0114222_103092 [Candidatus Kentron sp. FM]VFK15545.1 MAG: hypothetical protein BECKFM1743B_GA0114221_103763 [Candidatus Kentron sp. FM]